MILVNDGAAGGRGLALEIFTRAAARAVQEARRAILLEIVADGVATHCDLTVRVRSRKDRIA